MEHFSEQAWADFGRGFSASEKAQGIKAHLAAGCLNCKASSRFWGRLHTMALAESGYSPPENLVRLAKLEFAAKHEFQAEKWSLAGVLFDSFSQPLLAGVRSSAAVARQVVYEAEGLTVDLRFDRCRALGKGFRGRPDTRQPDNARTADWRSRRGLDRERPTGGDHDRQCIWRVSARI